MTNNNLVHLEWCVTEGGSAVCPPQAGDKVPPPEELTKKFLDQVLHYMTSHLLDIHWDDPRRREVSFLLGSQGGKLEKYRGIVIFPRMQGDP